MMTMIPCSHHLRLLELQQSLLYSATGSFFLIYITDEDCEVGRNDWHFWWFEFIWRIHLAAVESVIMYWKSHTITRAAKLLSVAIHWAEELCEVRRKYFCTEVLQRHRCISTVHRCHRCHRCTSTYFAEVIQSRWSHKHFLKHHVMILMSCFWQTQSKSHHCCIVL